LKPSAKAVAFIITLLAIGCLSVSVHAQSWHTIESWTMQLSSETNPYFYMVHGPFTENGLAYNGLVNVTVSFIDQSPLTFTLSNGGDYSFSSQHQAESLFWNLTTDYTHARHISFNSALTDEVYLYVGGASDILASYTVGVTDFVGLTNATVEVDKNVLGLNQVIERQNLDVFNAMGFYLVMYSQYSLKVVSDQGTFVWGLSADSVDTKNYAITKEMVTGSTTSIANATASATRWNGTCASVYFNDPTHLTSSVTTNIYIKNMTGQYLFYTQTDAGYVQNFVINNLDANTNYLARTVTAEGSWANSLPILTTTTSQWGASFDVFGDWSYLAKNAIGMFIVMTLISVGSWKDTEWFLGAGILVAAFLVTIGFLSIPWMGISAALLVVVLMFIDKGKKELPYS
jgi:hypothetical protein